MNGDSLAIMTAISDMRAEILEQVGEVKSSVSKLDGIVTSKLEAVEKTHEVFREELLGPGGRITEVEREQQTSNRRHWTITACVIPIIAALHYFADKLGIITK